MHELKKTLQSDTNIIYMAVKLKTLFLLHTTNTNIECPCSSMNVLAVKLTNAVRKYELSNLLHSVLPPEYPTAS
jgi:hypothetical protein